MATYQELMTRSQQVRDEQNIGGNTALRVGQLLMDIVKYFYDTDMAASDYLEQHFAMVNDGTQLLNWQQSPIVILHTMGETYDEGDFSALSQGENYYSAGFIMEANGQGGGINGETPKANVLYVNLANDTLYTWNGASFDAITSGGGGGSISGDDILKNAYYLNGNLVLIVETESGDKTVSIPVNFDASNYVPTSRTVNGKALSNNITLSQSDIPGLVAALAAKVKSVSVNNGTPALPDSNGNVNISVQGQDGKSAYQVAVDNGFIGSQAEWLASLNGNDGVENGDDVVVVNNYNGVPSDIQQGQVAVLGAALGMSIGKVFNVNTQDQNNATPYRLWIGTQQQLEALNEDYEDNTIYLVGIIPTVSQRFNVTFNGGSHTSIPANTPQTVKEGSAFSVVVSPASGYTIDSATGTMVGGTLTKTNNQDGTVSFSTSAVTGAITITAAATKHITGITVSAGTRTNNSIPLSAAVNPSDADNVTLAWSVDDTTNFGISGSGASATLTVKSGASNASVTITCQDTNASSGTASGTLQLTGITYDDAVPITALGAVSYVAGQNVNTYQFSVETTPANGNSPAIVWSVAATPSGVATINANTGLLTITDDCSVVVTATSGSNIASSSSIALTYAQDPNAPIVWEDANMEEFMLSKTTHANPNYITYAEAAVQPQIDSFYVDATASSYPFANVKDVVTKFNELQYFSNITKINLQGFSALTEVSFPYGASFASGNNTRISGSLVTELEIPEGCTSFAFKNVAGQYIESITFPTTLATIAATNGTSTLDCPLLKVLDLSNTAVTTIGWYRPTMAAVEIIKFPPSVTTVDATLNGVQLTRYSPNISYVSFGTATDGSELETLRIDSYSGHGISFVFYSSTPPTTASLGTVTAIYVPDAAVATYQAATGFTSYSSKIKGLSELPADWDTPSSNE